MATKFNSAKSNENTNYINEGSEASFDYIFTLVEQKL